MSTCRPQTRIRGNFRYLKVSVSHANYIKSCKKLTISYRRPPSEAFEEALPEREGSDLAEPPSFAYIFQTSG